jgi:predicted dehydrogenase
VRWGVIGCGGIAARRTIPEFQAMVSNAELISVMSRSLERARQIADKFNIPHCCATEAELLAQDIDAVYIATPPNVHCRQTILAAEAGKHVLCEKPMAITLKEVDDMEAACSRASVKFMLAFCMRNNSYNQKARELVQTGALGQMVMGRAQLTCWYPAIHGAWRQDVSISHGGALIDMGTHCLDLLEWIMGSKLMEVTGFQDLMSHTYATKVEDASTIVGRFSNSAHAIVDNYFNIPDGAAGNRLELYGTRGSIIAQQTIGQDQGGEMFSIIRPQQTYDANQMRHFELQREKYQIEGTGLYGQMIAVFGECILSGQEPPVTLEDGRHSVRLVNAIYQAVRERRVVQVQ